MFKLQDVIYETETRSDCKSKRRIIMRKKYTRGWHFVADTLRDGAPIPADGEWLRYDGDVRICESGLHYSLQPFDALQYAPGSTLCMVEVDDIVDTQTDKGVCRARRIVRRMDATEMMRYYARMQAVSVVHLWDSPDCVLDYLMMGDESMRDAAWAAAGAAARAEFNALVYECFGVYENDF